MLTSLKIDNFTLIDQLELSLQPGLNVLTGETGAGKSIILDAIDTVLGGKASGKLVRTGEKKALIEAIFHTPPPVADWLNANDIPFNGDGLRCSRELTTGRGSVRSRSRLNDVVVKKNQLEELRQLLVEITAQGQTVQLGSIDAQRDWLDGFAGSQHVKQRQAVAAAYGAATDAHQALDRRRRAEQQRQQQLDLFEYHAQDLSGADLQDADELDRLKQEHQRLSHSVELQKQSYEAYQVLYESDGSFDSCSDLLGRVEHLLSSMQRFDDQVTPVLDLVSDALAQVEEAGRQINTYGENLETDPSRLAEVESRMSFLKQLCRKYGRDLPELIEYYQEIQVALDALNGDGQSIETLEAVYEEAQAALIDQCSKLTKLRKKAAKHLEAQLVAELKPLAMERVKFKAELRSASPQVHGADVVEFLFSPNPGEPLQPLTEIASGGEMSRFLLAFKACFSKVDPIGTLIFDEIDVGVSGRVAQTIAEKLYQLSQSRQVLCVTHQPLVAAMADAHFHVDKQVVVAGKKKTDERTVVRVTGLDDDARREELAQLAGGRSHQEGIAFAESLLAQAATLRQAE
ncbi:DNA repair protein RecN [Leptothoe kymatousa]|uniref:DNA repair protein RecN n=1 Tax=Leptothoe kymatousa TAU-MAC 1615 TaxID=2364775 RepID=A0ABS5Y3D2_9CYAN|nr:DNA repair protein RecN [Leptothoe kymatousa]MBT9312348.1 DNA repair protein RecN [Leptothoe kymatousa TAU-MAC 1615]